jgi:short-subunit dehydrogenase|tara:strand:+ start:101 stop:670 length:570 start_codon:yes stop_codon:yes gene_type:complete
MKRILLIGGSSRIGQHIIDTAPCDIDNPSSSVLDLKNMESISNYNYQNYDCLVLVAGAGMRHGKNITFDNVDLQYTDDTININCTGNTMLLQKYLKHNTEGHVVVIGSNAIYKTKTPNVIYSATKFYLDRLLDILENTYEKTMFIKINPAKVSSRFEYNEDYIEPEMVADSVWHCIKNNIKKLDISNAR